MTLSPRFRRLVYLGAVLGLVSGCGNGPGQKAVDDSTGRNVLKVAFRSEPANFNRLVSAKAAEQRVTMLTQSTLVRVNPITDELEPRLAESWTASKDGLTWTLKLRDGVVFSDGVPLTAADVVFTFDMLYDKGLDSVMASGFTLNHKPLVVSAIDDHTVTVTFPLAYSPGLRLLDPLPILPKHKLETALASGKLRDTWGPSTPPSDIVGAGPFVVSEIKPGQSLRFSRNPHYWGRDAQGHALPYVDAVDVEIVPSQDAEVLRLESGDVDLTQDFIRPEDLAVLRPLADQGKFTLIDAGVSVDASAMWFDLTPDSASSKGRPWLQSEELRQAISLAVDRKAIVESVFLGAAVPIAGPITPGYGGWYTKEIAPPARDLPKAKTLLAAAGLVDYDREGMLVEHGTGDPIRFSLLTNKERPDRIRTATLIAAQLKEVGLAVDVVSLEQQSVVQHIREHDYDAVYFGTQTNSRDPLISLDFWPSSGSFHFWHPEQKKPATTWEAQIDSLIQRQLATQDVAARQRAFVQVQKIFTAHVPVIYLAAPTQTVAVGHRLHGARAGVFQPPVLWNVDSLSIGTSDKQ